MRPCTVPRFRSVFIAIPSLLALERVGGDAAALPGDALIEKGRR